MLVYKRYMTGYVFIFRSQMIDRRRNNTNDEKSNAMPKTYSFNTDK